ncbi:MAG: hydrogenase expression/formation protein HypE [Spirochaetaceae bacterium]|nr:hydrogenase expression/formation protein HypE [Spirochaetaceae bacterium]
MTDNITMTHGSGGRQMHNLIHDHLISRLQNGILEKLDDSARLQNANTDRLAMTTDSYVVSPLFFKGGDIGRLCVCGTVNDLATSGAEASYLSLAFILEEGFPLDDLKKIIDSIAETAKEADVKIVTGDTKVVEKGKGDGIYINTCGIGFIPDGVNLSTYNGAPGDLIAVTGSIGNHETALMLARNLLKFDTSISSDAAPLNKKISRLLKLTKGIKTVKDPTRGGLASALSEIAEHSNCEIILQEDKIPVDKDVQAVCELAGLDPLFLANEGKYVIVCDPSSADAITQVFPKAEFIGEITDKQPKGRLLIETVSGGLRKIGMLETAQLPRIC